MSAFLHFDRDGRLFAADARLSKAVIAPYRGNEIPDHDKLGLDPDRVYRMLKHPDEIERVASRVSGLPIYSKHIDEHRPELVIGAVGTARYRNGCIVGDIALWSRQAIDAVRRRTRPALSMGYRYHPLMFRGRHNGQTFDGAITRMEPTHIALVPQGRYGPGECEI